MYGNYANGDFVRNVEDINPTLFKPSIAVGPGQVVVPMGTKVMSRACDLCQLCVCVCVCVR